MFLLQAVDSTNESEMALAMQRGNEKMMNEDNVESIECVLESDKKNKQSKDKSLAKKRLVFLQEQAAVGEGTFAKRNWDTAADDANYLNTTLKMPAFRKLAPLNLDEKSVRLINENTAGERKVNFLHWCEAYIAVVLCLYCLICALCSANTLLFNYCVAVQLFYYLNYCDVVIQIFY